MHDELRERAVELARSERQLLGRGLSGLDPGIPLLDRRDARLGRIHRADRDWAETNCYVDIWIELLHAWGFEPIAALPFTFGIDFEGDQWTFYKPPLADLPLNICARFPTRLRSRAPGSARYV